MASFTERMMGAAKLDVQVYEEVEADTSATSQAMGVVLLSSLASGIGSVGLGAGGLGGFVGGGIAALIGWVVWAFPNLHHWHPAAARTPNARRHRRADANSGVCPVTRSGSHRRTRPRRGSLRLQHRLDLDAGGHGDRRSSSSGLHEHLPGGRCVSCGVGFFDRD